jgi:hypothetical protein
MGRNTTFLLVSLLAVLTASPKALTHKFGPLESSGAQGSDQGYFYCVLIDEAATRNKRVFFTSVFPGDNSSQRTYEMQFSAWVNSRYTRVIGDPSCRFAKSKSTAVVNREDEKVDASRENRAVIETNWHP